MTHRCHECSRLNPAEATFCYFDGVVLNGRNAAAGSIDFSSWAFPSPFVFPGGQQWRTAMLNLPIFADPTPQSLYDRLAATAIVPATGKPDPAAMTRFSRALATRRSG